MCVIIHKPKGVELAEKYIREAAKINSHGFGIMYYDEEAGQIVVYKKAKYDLDGIIKKVKEMKDVEAVLHFRIKTHGSVKDENCHPFQVLSQKHNAMEMWMMHNGTIRNVLQQVKDDETDTNAFIRTMVTPMLKLKAGIIRTEAMQTYMKEYITGSRLVFMFGAGEVVIINKDSGTEKDGCWFSNTTAFPSAYEYNSTGGRSYLPGRRGRHTSSNTSNVNQYPFRLLDTVVSKGDKVNVWDKDSDSYLGEGTIKEVFQAFILVEVLLDNELRTMNIDVHTGESVYHSSVHNNKANRYYCMPENYQDAGDYEKKTVGQITAAEEGAEEEDSTAEDEAVAQAKETEKKEDTPCSRSCSQPCTGGCVTDVINLDDKRKQRDASIQITGTNPPSQEELEQLQDEVDGHLNYDKDGKKKEIGESVTSSTDDTGFQSELVTYEEGAVEKIVNYTMRLGANNLESVYQGYGDEGNPLQIIDVYHMTPQERFQLYMGQPEIGFAMFNDMLEYYCLYGAEYTEEQHEEWMASFSNEDEESDEDNSSPSSGNSTNTDNTSTSDSSNGIGYDGSFDVVTGNDMFQQDDHRPLVNYNN